MYIYIYIYIIYRKKLIDYELFNPINIWIYNIYYIYPSVNGIKQFIIDKLFYYILYIYIYIYCICMYIYTVYVCIYNIYIYTHTHCLTPLTDGFVMWGV